MLEEQGGLADRLYNMKCLRDVRSAGLVRLDIGRHSITGGGGHGEVLELHLVHIDVPVGVKSPASEIFGPERGEC